MGERLTGEDEEESSEQEGGEEANAVYNKEYTGSNR